MPVKILGTGFETSLSNSSGDAEVTTVESQMLEYFGDYFDMFEVGTGALGTGNGGVIDLNYDSNAASKLQGTGRGCYLAAKGNSGNNNKLIIGVDSDILDTSVAVGYLTSQGSFSGTNHNLFKITTNQGDIFGSYNNGNNTLNLGTTSNASDIATTALTLSTNTYYWVQFSLATNGDIYFAINGTEINGNVGAITSISLCRFGSFVTDSATADNHKLDDLTIYETIATGKYFPPLYKYGNIAPNTTDDAGSTGWTGTGGASDAHDAMIDYDGDTTGQSVSISQAVGFQFDTIGTLLPGASNGASSIFGFNMFFDDCFALSNENVEMKIVNDGGGGSVAGNLLFPLSAGYRFKSNLQSVSASDYVLGDLANIRAVVTS